MAYRDRITTALWPRRVGLQTLPVSKTGGTHGETELLVGPEYLRMGITSETTAKNMACFGISVCSGTSIASSAVYQLDPPIPGCRKIVVGGVNNGPIYFKTMNSEVFLTTAGSSHTVCKISSMGGAAELMGLTTASWVLYVTSGTSSQPSGFGLTTTT